MRVTCQDPCDGSVAPWTARDGWWSGQVHPARLIQVGWTNPLTNVILLEAGLAANRQLYDFSQHRYYTPNPDIPRVVEFGDDRWCDSRRSQPQRARLHHLWRPVGTVVRQYRRRGGATTAQRLAAARVVLVCDRRARAKIGYDGGYFAQTRRNRTNNTRLEYRYDTPAVDLLQRRESGGVHLRQHEPLLPERPVQPGAPAGAHASQNQYGPVHHR